LVLTGGIDIEEEEVVRDTRMVNIKNQQTQVWPYLNVARCCHTMIFFNKTVFVIGGIGKKSKFLKSVESYDID